MEPRKSARATMRWAVSSLVAAAMLAGAMGGCEPASTPDGGTDGGGASLTTPNDVPDLTFTKPNSSAPVYIGQTLQVSWYATDYDNATVTTLYFDRDGLKGSGDEMQLTQVQKGANDYSESTFAWNTSQMTPGTYRLLGVVSDGVNAPVTVYNPHSVVMQSSTPTITLVEPYGPKTVMPAENLVINWTQYAPLGPSTVTLFFDTNTSYTDGIAGTILTKTEQPSTRSDSYVWNVPAVAAGNYYLGAVLSDGTHPPMVVYANGVLTIDGPTLTVYSPSVDMELHSGGSVAIRYEVDSPHGGNVRIFYDRDGVAGSGDEVWLPYSKTVAAGSQSWTWQAAALALGTYHVGVEVVDGVNDPIVVYAQGLVKELGPTVTVTAPTGVTNWAGGGSVNVVYKAFAAGGTAEIFYDIDGEGGTGDEVIAAGPFPVQNAITVTQTLTVPVLVPNTYHVGVKMSDGALTFWGYAPGTIVVGPPPPLSLSAPAGNVVISPGNPVTIAWINPPAGAATLDLFYDVDMDATNGTSGSIATALPVVPTTYSWTVPNISNPPAAAGYYIGAIVTDSQGAQPATYAAGLVTILDRKFYSYSLGEVEKNRLGRTFQGFSPNGQLGKVVTHLPWKFELDPRDPASGTLRLQPGISTNGDNYDDFILTAPTGNPFYLERVKSGESYLVLSDPALLFAPPAVGTFGPLVVSATGSSKLPGAIFAGPAHTDAPTSAGIGGVALSRDADGDQVPEIVFGIPHAHTLHYNGQDYDPWDNFEYNVALQANPDYPGGPEDLVVTYKDQYRRPYAGTETNPDGLPTDMTDWRTVTAGMMIAVSGQAPAIQSPPNVVPQQVVIPLDSVGHPSIDPHPRVVNGTLPGGLRGPNGVQFFCPWWFENSSPHYAEHPGGPLDFVQTPHDLSYFGESVVEADLDGDGSPEWIGTQPFDPNPVNGSGLNEGWLHVIWSSRSVLWNAPFDPTQAPGAWQNSGRVIYDLVDVDINISQQGTSTRTESRTRTIQGPPDYTWGAWSWPYAFTHGDATFTETIITTTDNTTTPATVTVSDSVVAQDDRERWYCWPVTSDYIQGDTGEGANGHLSCLGNVGDFNGQGKDCITVGAPRAKPGNIVDAGCVYLIFGRATFADHSLATVGTVAPGALAGIKIRGEHAGDLVGSWQASAGDFDGDGYSDWIIGVPGYSLRDSLGNVTRANCGLAAIVYGDPYLQGAFSLSDIGTAKLRGLVFVGEVADAMAGTAVAGVGDVDGDGYDDATIVAAHMDWTLRDGTTRTNCGVAYLIYGTATVENALDGDGKTIPINLEAVGTANLPGLIYAGPNNNQPLATVGPAGDVDGDGYADFLIGNPNYDIIDPAGVTLVPKVGQVYLIRGGDRPTP